MTHDAEIVFYLLAAVVVVGALGVVLVPNVVHAALFLICRCSASPGFYILLSSEFLALVQILVYGGAVATIILFGLMLTRGRDDAAGSARRRPEALAAVCSRRRCSARSSRCRSDATGPRDIDQVTIVAVQRTSAQALFNRWAVPFEIASGVLLVALIGAVVISTAGRGGGVGGDCCQRRYPLEHFLFVSARSCFRSASTACWRAATRC